MPQKELKFKNKKDDGRYKILPKEYDNVKKLYKKPTSIHSLSRIYKVDRGTIKNIIFPEKYKKQLEDYKKQKHSIKYYNKQTHTLAMRKTRLKKRKMNLILIKTKARKYTKEYLNTH